MRLFDVEIPKGMEISFREEENGDVRVYGRTSWKNEEHGHLNGLSMNQIVTRRELIHAAVGEDGVMNYTVYRIVNKLTQAMEEK